MNIHKSQQIPDLAVGATRNATASFVKSLDSGETITGTPTVVEQTTSDLTLTNKAVNGSAITLENGEVVGVSQGVQFTIKDQVVANSPYLILVTATTSASQVIPKWVTFNVVSG